MPWYLPFSNFIPSILVIYCNQANYGPVPSGGVETGAKGVQAMVGTGTGWCGRDADGGLGGGIYWDGRAYIWDVDGYRISLLEDKVANITFGKKTNAPLAYATVLEQHHPIIITLRGAGV